MLKSYKNTRKGTAAETGWFVARLEVGISVSCPDLSAMVSVSDSYSLLGEDRKEAALLSPSRKVC